MTAVRAPAVAGYFYPADPAALCSELNSMLAAVPPARDASVPKILIVPHAGYVYSGPIAASGYARLSPGAGNIRRVVLLGPAHRVAVRGLALPEAKSFATPLGRVALDQQAIDTLADLPQVVVSDAAHALEHSLEVHLPFMQTVLGEFQLVPLVVGRATEEEVAAVLERLWGGPETLIVISTDLSHYLPYDTARQTDAESVARMLRLESGLDHEQACGATPVNGLLALARRRGLRPELIDLRNSGDTAGDKARVVGYAALALHETQHKQVCETERGEMLLAAARGAVGERLGEKPAAIELQPWLLEQGASFVTLTLNGDLRGCIGSLQAHRPLLEDVRRNAIAAAFHDPRFLPLNNHEFARVRIEVSELGAAEPLAFESEAHALTLLRPHRDGLVLEYGPHRSTFLPQVWETLARPDEFLAQLKRKAGLPADFWHEDIKLSRYGVTQWKEAARGRD
jgi:AmmeMemoRadiSam system protein B/AmmeMemoRadiSam system protein A